MRRQAAPAPGSENGALRPDGRMPNSDGQVQGEKKGLDKNRIELHSKLIIEAYGLDIGLVLDMGTVAGLEDGMQLHMRRWALFGVGNRRVR